MANEKNFNALIIEEIHRQVKEIMSGRFTGGGGGGISGQLNSLTGFNSPFGGNGGSFIEPVGDDVAPEITEEVINNYINNYITTQIVLANLAPQNPWKVLYTDATGIIQELALGIAGTYLKSNGIANVPSFSTPAGGGGSSGGVFGLLHSEASYVTKVMNYNQPPVNLDGFTNKIECGVNCNITTGTFTILQAGYYKITLKAIIVGDSAAMKTGYNVYINGNNPNSLYGFAVSGNNMDTSDATQIASTTILTLLNINNVVNLCAGIYSGTQQIIIWHKIHLLLEFMGKPS